MATPTFRDLCRAATLGICLTVLTSATAGAQAPGLTIGIGYQAIRTNLWTLPAGAAFDLAVDLPARLAVIGGLDVSGGRQEPFGFRQSSRLLALSGGVRVRPFQRWRLAPFAQALVGRETTRLRVDPFGEDTLAHGFVQPGVGVELEVAARHRLFTQVDWRIVGRDLFEDDGVRVSIGGRFTLR